MATDKPRVQAYLPSDVAEQFRIWRTDQGISESEAITRILNEFFAGIPVEHLPSSAPKLASEFLGKYLA
jgi:hypothetical protein